MKIMNIYTQEVIFEDESASNWEEVIKGALRARADLYGADLRGAKNLEQKLLAQFKITPEEGEFKAWKKTSTGVIQILIPENAARCNAIGSRKCRASEVIVLGGSGAGGSSPTHTQKNPSLTISVKL